MAQANMDGMTHNYAFWSDDHGVTREAGDGFYVTQVLVEEEVGRNGLGLGRPNGPAVGDRILNTVIARPIGNVEGRGSSPLLRSIGQKLDEDDSVIAMLIPQGLLISVSPRLMKNLSL